MPDDPKDFDKLYRHVHAELVDSFDEELEMEIDDEARSSVERRRYFRELFKLQAELVKLQGG